MHLLAACDTAAPSAMYYFDSRADDCSGVEYQGCGGNDNRFRSYDECRESCLRGTCCVRSLLREDLLYGYSPSGYDRLVCINCTSATKIVSYDI